VHFEKLIVPQLASNFTPNGSDSTGKDSNLDTYGMRKRGGGEGTSKGEGNKTNLPTVYSISSVNDLKFCDDDILVKKSVVLSPLANYTDRAIAAGQRS
jgi:hypothetical protein